VAVVFAVNGFMMASWMARLPVVRDELDLTPGRLGLLLLALSLGSLAGLPVAGRLVERLGARTVVGAGVVAVAVAQVSGAVAVQHATAAVVAPALVLFGFGIGTWDVAMNLHGARVEHALGRTIMPRFHAAFSLGTVLGAGAGAGAAATGLPLPAHLALVGVLAVLVVLVAVRAFLPGREVEDDGAPSGRAGSAWREPRTLLVGLMVLALALTEGTANDWLTVALVDGYDLPDWAGALGFGLFVTAMTAGRMVGTTLLDRHGRVRVLWATMALAGAGVLLTVLAGDVVLAMVGVALWGLGGSLGFPVGMSAAADDPRRAAARVSVVSTIGYTAFLAGPPLVGFVADRVGTLDALLVVAVLLVPSALVVPAAREPRQV
jgi:predicted MFS family arabinose efflux permease